MKTHHPDLSLVLACYNEELLLEDSLQQISEILNLSRLSYEIILVDDHSTDNTVDIIKKICNKYAHCTSILHTANTGRGKAVSDGFKKAKGTVIGYIDVDLEVSPVYIPQMVQIILTDKADCVVGKRIYRSSLARLAREIYSIGYQKISDILVGTDGIDTESGYKFFRKTKALPLLSLTQHPHWFWDTEMMVYARKANLRILEVPVLFIRRLDKQSSVKVLKDISDYLMSLWKFRQRLQREQHL